MLAGAPRVRTCHAAGNTWSSKGGIWLVSVAVPGALVSHFGKTCLKRSLGTDSLLIANHIKLSIVTALRAEIETARAHSPQNPLSRHATALATALRRAEGDGARREPLHVEIGDLRVRRFQVDRRGGGLSLLTPEHADSPVQKLVLPRRDLVRMHVVLLRQLRQRLRLVIECS